MPNIFGVLNVGEIALLTQQKAIDVTGNNIANVNTPGYSRQELNMEQAEPIRYGTGQMGTGVYGDKKVQRAYDQFIEAQIANESQNLGRWDAQEETLGRVELIFDESTGYGLNQAMSQFWNAWQDLSNDPSGYVERTTLVMKSQNLTSTFNTIYDNLQQIQVNVDNSINGAIDEINHLSSQLADLNLKIASAEVGGHSANDFRDQRDLLLKELSTMIGGSSFEDGNGNLTVMTGEGKPLVEGGKSWVLNTAPNAVGNLDVFWTNSSGAPENITQAIEGGEIKGWIQTRDVIIEDYITRLDDLASGIIGQVNALHTGGLDINGVPGEDFFSGGSAADMGVNANIVNNVSLVAAGTPPASGPGDNSGAILIANLQNDLTMNGNTATFDDFYNSLVGDIGNDVLDAAINSEHGAAMMDLLKGQREMASGVSLDEEMVNLVKFQHAYDAAAKLISTVDEMIATIVNMV